MTKPSVLHCASQQYQEIKLSHRPLGQLGKPDDVAHGYVYQASEEEAYVTGTELVIDGGLTST
jgi:NAD(P)-dependent dehydrogenase (short-subunit alcohol dehydrogenase family)